MKQLSLFRIFAILLMASTTAARALDSDTADYLLASPESYLDQTVSVNALSVRPSHYETRVQNVVWFRVRTGKMQPHGRHYNTLSGGFILAAVDSSQGTSFLESFGDGHSQRNDGYITPHPLTGIFRAWDKFLAADPNHRLVDLQQNGNGLYFIDCTTQGQFKQLGNATNSSPAPSPSTTPR